MASISVNVRNWLNHALYEGESWPHDPLNRGIALVLINVGLPGLIVGGIALEITRWDRFFPRWLSFSLVFYVFAIGWFILDEWRSRRRPEDGNGHGWIWQMIQRFWPRRRVNQMMVTVIMIAYVARAVLLYLDRFTRNDLADVNRIVLAEAIGVVVVDLWLVVMAVLWIRWRRPADPYWRTVAIFALVMAAVNSLISVNEGIPWVAFALMLAVVLALPGWLAYTIWKRRTASAQTASKVPANLPPPWW